MSNTPASDFGTLLRQYRVAAGLSQQALAERAGVSARGISDLERGINRSARPDTLHLLADALALPPAQRAALMAVGGRRVRDLALAADLLPVMPQFPAPLTPLVGREREVGVVRALLGRAEVRLLTLIGPGGVGKTRLAIAAAEAVCGDFAGGVTFVPLAAVRNPALVVPAIAQALGVREADGGPIRALLTDCLRAESRLLVLDNFEQVTDAASDLAALLAGCPNLKVMATSRAALRVPGEHAFTVPPLTLPVAARAADVSAISHVPAVDLFVQRAVAVRSDFRLTPANAGVVAAICRRLDGLPLAIELAAARARMLPPEAMLRRLDRRLPLLTGGAPSLPARQQTLRGAMDWSHDLLDEGEQRLFRRLAMFAGSATLEAVEAVCNADGEGIPSDGPLDVLTGIDSLLAKSLVWQVEGEGAEPRFGMLETIREYAAERLDVHDEAEGIHQAYAQYFLGLAEHGRKELGREQQAAWLRRLEEEHDNLRAVLGWAVEGGEASLALRLTAALWRFWQVRGYLSEGRRWIALALAMPGEGTVALRADALRGAGVLAKDQGDFPAARAFLGESVALARERGDTWGIAASLNHLGLIAWGQGDAPAARGFFEESLTLAREQRDTRGIAASLNHLGLMAHDRGDFAAAQSLYEESLVLRKQRGDTWGIALSLGNLGNVARNRGDYPTSRALHEESLALRRALGDKQGIALNLHNLGELARDAGNYPASGALHEESLALSREVGDKQGIAVSLYHLATLACDRSDDAAARHFLGEALRTAHEIGDKPTILRCLERIADMVGVQGDPRCAARLSGVAAAQRDALGIPLSAADHVAHERSLAIAQAETDKATWEAARSAGRAMPLHDAIVYALACLTGLHPV